MPATSGLRIYVNNNLKVQMVPGRKWCAATAMISRWMQVTEIISECFLCEIQETYKHSGWAHVILMWKYAAQIATTMLGVKYTPTQLTLEQWASYCNRLENHSLHTVYQGEYATLWETFLMYSCTDKTTQGRIGSWRIRRTMMWEKSGILSAPCTVAVLTECVTRTLCRPKLESEPSQDICWPVHAI